MNTPAEHTSTDQPELVNEPNILYNRQGNDIDARGIPKVGDLRYRYQRSIDQLFFATEKCYFIMGESARIIGEEWDTIVFEFNDTGVQKRIDKNKAHEMMEETYTKDNSTSSKLCIPYFGSEFLHKLESKTWKLDDPRTKEALLNRYENIFSITNKNEYPSDQWRINSLFYMSILLDFDKDKQKKVAKYFINNCLNTLYTEDDHHYGLSGKYTVKQIWDKIWISVHPIYDWDNYGYLSPSDCKKIADNVEITDEEFNDIVYDACMFKMWDHSKASASGHRSTCSKKMLMEECKKYLNPQQKEEIENYQYIFQNFRGHTCWIYYGINYFQRIKLLLEWGLTTKDIKEKLESDEKITITDILEKNMKDIWEEVYTSYKNHIFDLNMEEIAKQSVFTKGDNIFLMIENDNLILTNNKNKYIWNDNMIWSCKIAVYKDHNYDHEKNIPIYHGARKYKLEIFHWNRIDKNILYSVTKIIASYDNLELNLHY